MMNENNARIDLYAQLTLLAKLRTKRSRPPFSAGAVRLHNPSQCKFALKGFCHGGLFSGPMKIEQNVHLDPHFESIVLNVSCEISATT